MPSLLRGGLQDELDLHPSSPCGKHAGDASPTEDLTHSGPPGIMVATRSNGSKGYGTRLHVSPRMQHPKPPSPVTSTTAVNLKLASVDEGALALDGDAFVELVTRKVSDLLHNFLTAREEAHAQTLAALLPESTKRRKGPTEQFSESFLPLTLDKDFERKEFRIPLSPAALDDPSRSSASGGREDQLRSLTAPPPHGCDAHVDRRRWRLLVPGVAPGDGISNSLPAGHPPDDDGPDGSIGLPVSCPSRASKVSRKSDVGSIFTGEPTRQRLIVRRAWTSIVMAGQGRQGDAVDWNLLRNQSSTSMLLKRSTTRDSLDKDMESSVLWTTSRFILRPDSSMRLAFEVLSVFALLHDSVVLPFVYAWEPKQNPYLQTSLWLVMLFWTMDLVLNFFTGFYVEGEVEMHWARIAKHYFKHWFFMDFAFCVCDWLGALSELTNARGVEFAVVLRVGRFFRLAALIRLVRHYSRIMNLADVPLSRNQSFLVQCLQLLVAVFWANHFSACVWYKIGTLQLPDTGLSWLDSQASATYADGGALLYREAGNVFQYATAMHWSMTQMTPGSMEVFPVNTLERIWNIIFLFFGLLFGTSLVSYFSSKMVQHRIAMREESQRMELLRRFLHENEVSALLSNRVQKQVRARMWMRTRLREEDVPALELLTTSIRNDVRREAFLRHLVRHPLFQAISHFSELAVTHLCTSGSVAFACVAQGEEYFAPGEDAVESSLVLKGDFRFTPVFGALDDLLRYPTVQDVESGRWLCEVALFMEWRHQGTLEAKSTCEMLAVNAAGFGKSVHKFKRLWPLLYEWCEAFKLTQLSVDDVHAKDDLDVTTDHCAIMFALPEATSEFVQTSSIHLFKATQGIASKFLKGHLLKNDPTGKYEEEMLAGTAVLYIDGTGSLVKSEHLIEVQLLSAAEQKRMLVKLADFDPDRGGWTQVCALPGRKARRGETSKNVLDSLIESDFPLFVDAVHVGSEDVTTTDTWVYVDGVRVHVMCSSFGVLIDQEKHDALEELHMQDRRGIEGSFLHEMRVYAVQSCSTAYSAYAWVTAEELENLQDRAETKRYVERLMHLLPPPANMEVRPTSPKDLSRRRWRRDSMGSRLSIPDLGFHMSERASPKANSAGRAVAEGEPLSPRGPHVTHFGSV